jgi:hypothetical protein
MKTVQFLAVILIMACSMDEAPTPVVVATVEDLVEFDDGYAKTGHVALKLENQTKIPVYSFTVALTLKTDKNTYYQTLRDDRGVPPETTIWVNVQVQYVDSSESSDLDGIQISDLYFE